MAVSVFVCSDGLSIASLAVEFPPRNAARQEAPPSLNGSGRPPPGGKGGLPARRGMLNIHMRMYAHFSLSYIHIRASVDVCMRFCSVCWHLDGICTDKACKAPQTLIPEILRRRRAFRPGIQCSSLRRQIEIQIFLLTSTFKLSSCTIEPASSSFRRSFSGEGITQTAAAVFLRSGGPSAAPAQPQSQLPPAPRGAARQEAALQCTSMGPGLPCQAGHLLGGKGACLRGRGC